jgi:hypothetical protein
MTAVPKNDVVLAGMKMSKTQSEELAKYEIDNLTYELSNLRTMEKMYLQNVV